MNEVCFTYLPINWNDISTSDIKDKDLGHQVRWTTQPHKVTICCDKIYNNIEIEITHIKCATT